MVSCELIRKKGPTYLSAVGDLPVIEDDELVDEPSELCPTCRRLLMTGFDPYALCGEKKWLVTFRRRDVAPKTGQLFRVFDSRTSAFEWAEWIPKPSSGLYDLSFRFGGVLYDNGVWRPGDRL